MILESPSSEGAACRAGRSSPPAACRRCAPGTTSPRRCRDAAAPRARLEARWRVQPAPSACATVGAPMVFLPALGLTQHSWAGVTAKLAACRPRVLVDLPGVGEAPRDRRVRCRGRDGRRSSTSSTRWRRDGGRIVLAGHSLGGAIAARLGGAARRARVEALVLVAAPVSTFPLEPLGEAAAAAVAVAAVLARRRRVGGRAAGARSRRERRRPHRAARRGVDRGGVERPSPARRLAPVLPRVPRRRQEILRNGQALQAPCRRPSCACGAARTPSCRITCCPPPMPAARR